MMTNPLKAAITISFGFIILLLLAVAYQQRLIINSLYNISYTPVPTVFPSAGPLDAHVPTPSEDYPQSLSSTPSPKPESLVKAKLLSTSTWQEHECGAFSFKLPAEGYRYNCAGGEGQASVSITDLKNPQGMAAIIINFSKYDGGSRRQYWINKNGDSPESIAKYARFEETQYGPVTALAVYADGSWWQGGGVSSILIAKGTSLIWLNSYAMSYNADTGAVVSDPFTNTIASTLKFR